MVSTSAHIKQALVVALRANNPLKSAVSGIYEGFAPAKATYPFLVYTTVYAPYDFAWGSAILRTAFDIVVWSENSVEANNLDALVIAAIDNQPIEVTGQSTLLCRRVNDLSSQDVDEEGKKVYQAGGTYSVWTDQQL